MRRSACIVLAAIVAAWAQPADAGSSRQEAEQLLREGNALSDQGDHVGALAKYRSAYDSFPTYKLWLNIGTELRELDRNAEALEAYEKYLAHPEADPAVKQQLDPIVADLAGGVGVLSIEVDGAHGRVVANGRDYGPAVHGLRLRVDPGSQSIVAECRSGPAAVANVTIGAGQELPVRLRCVRPEPQPPVRPDRQPTLPDRETPSSRLQQTIGFVVRAAGLVGLGLAVGFRVDAVATHDEALSWCTDRDPDRCSKEGVDLNDEAKRSETISTVMFVVGGAALSTGAVLLLTAPGDDDVGTSTRARVRLLPMVGPRAAGASVFARF